MYKAGGMVDKKGGVWKGGMEVYSLVCRRLAKFWIHVLGEGGGAIPRRAYSVYEQENEDVKCEGVVGDEYRWIGCSCCKNREGGANHAV